MRWARQALLSGACAAFGVGAAWFAPAHLSPWSIVAGVVSCVFAFDLALRAMLAVNNADTRAVYLVAGVALGATLYRGSGSWVLAAAPVALPLLTWPGELVVRRFGYHLYRAWIVAPVVSALLALAAWPPSWWSLAMVVPLARVGRLVPRLADGLERFRGQNRKAWSVRLGKPVPDFALPESGTGETWRLSDQRGTRVLIQFSRGDWCPVCHVMMRVLKREAERLRDHNVVVVMISATEGADAEEFVRELGLPYRILRDPNSETAKAYGAFDPSAFGGKGGNLPATFVVAPDGTLALCSRSDDVASFLDPSEVLRLLEQPAA